MKNAVGASLISVALAVAPFSDSKADNLENRRFDDNEGNNVKTELYQNLNDDTEMITLDGAKESAALFPIDARIITDAALSYFDEEVKLYSLKGEARVKVEKILMEYLRVHPILKKSSDLEILFIIDNKKEFAAMIKNLANILFDGMPKIIREVAIFLAFGGNEELQKTLNNLDSTVMNLPTKQYKDIVFDYFGGIVKRVASTIGGGITVREYYDSVYKYYPNKNHTKIQNELDKTGQLDDNIVDLKYPFKKAK